MLTTASAGAISDPKIGTSNYLKVLEDADSAKESILFAPDPFEGSWVKTVSRQSENYSAIALSSADLNSFDPNILFKNDLSKEKNKTKRDYIKLIEPNQMDNQYLSGSRNENIPNTDHPIFGSDSNISVANSDLKLIYQSNADLNRQKKKDIMDGENQIYLSYLDPNSLKRPDEVRQVAHLVNADDSYLYLQPPGPENLMKSTSITTQNKPNNGLYQELSTFETGKDEVKKITQYSNAIDKKNSVGVRDSFYSHLFDLRLIEKTSKPSVQSADSTIYTADGTESLNLVFSEYQKTPGRIDDISQKNLNSLNIPEKFLSSGHRENAYQNYAVVVGIDEYNDRMS